MHHRSVELAKAVSRALITESNKTQIPTRAWTSSLDQTLHRLNCRNSLTPQLVARVIDPFLLHHPSLAFGFFNWASQQPSFSHTSLTYQPILKSLSLSRQFTSIHKLLKQIRIDKIQLHPSVYTLLVTSLLAAKKAHLAFAVFSQVGTVIGPGSCNSLLAAMAAGGNLKCACQVFDEMTQRRVRFNTLGFGVFLWWVCREKEMSGVLSLLDQVRRLDFSGVDGSVVALLVVHGLCKVRRVNDAICGLEWLRERGCKPDFMAYRVVAETACKMGNVVDEQMILKRKRKLGVAPRVGEYREFIFQLVKERLTREAKELGEVIVSGNFEIHDDVLNVLIGSVSTIDPLLAIVFLKFMLDKERLPTLLTVNNLIENLCKHEKEDKLFDVFEHLSRKDYFKNLESYNVMIYFLCKTGRVREGYGVLQEMRKKGLVPNIASYNCLLKACCRDDLLRPAKRLWDEMFASGCCGNAETYNILIRKFSEVGQVKDASHLFHHMVGNGLEPDYSTYKSLLEGLCLANDLETVRIVFNKCTQHDVKLANSLESVLTANLCKETACIVFNKCTQHDVKLTNSSESVLTANLC